MYLFFIYLILIILFKIFHFKYDKLGKLTKDFEPYKNLWITTSDWLRWFESWMNDPISSIDAENIDRNANDAYKTMHKAIKQFQDLERKYYFQILISH